MYKDNNLFITVYLDVRRKRKKDGLYPLRVRVKYGETTNYYSAGLYFDKDSFEKITKGRRLSVDELKQKELVNAVIKRAHKAASEPFSFNRFKRAWKNENAKADVFCFFDEKISSLRKEGKFSTAGLYTNALNALKNYHSGTTLSFNSITPEWLGDFVSWMKTADKEARKKKSSQTTISMYLRCFRSIFNVALKQKETKNYPFSGKDNHEGYKIPKPEKTKYPLTEDELNKLKAYQPTGTEQFWYDMFMFSYYAGGINIKDIALLKKTNLVNNSLSYSRTKTLEKNPIEYVIPIGPEAEEIINRWKTDSAFLFPLIDDSMDEEKIFKTIKFKVRNINKVIKAIAARIGIQTPISTYTARHTFASRLAHLGAPLTLISESLHHANTKTTQIYLGKFPSKEKKEWFKKL